MPFRNLASEEAEEAMPPEKIYEPLILTSDADRSKAFTDQSRSRMLKLYDMQLENLREQSNLLDNLNKLKKLGETASKSQFSNVYGYLKDLAQLKENSEVNFKSMDAWYMKQKAEINNEFEIECEKYREEFHENKEKLKESLINEQLNQIPHNQLLNAKNDIESKIKADTKCKPNLNKGKSPEASLANISYVSLVTTRSKKRLAAAKLRPRLNGRASLTSPMTVKWPDKKHVRIGVKTTAGVPHVKDPKLLQTSNVIINQSSNKKTKPNSIENKLKIKFKIEEKDINDDLKLLNQTC